MKTWKKRFLLVVLVFSLCMVFSLVAEASIYGYAAKYTDSIQGSFVVYAPGTSTSSGGITLKTSDFPASAVVDFNIFAPDGKRIIPDRPMHLTGNDEQFYTFYTANPGNYTVVYRVMGTEQGWLHCWIY